MPHLNPGRYASDGVDWLTQHLPWLFDGISSGVSTVVSHVTDALTGPPAGGWIAVLTLGALLTRGWLFAAYTAAGFALILSMGLWTESMQTLAVVVIAAGLATLIGVPIGIAAARSRGTRLLVRPVLDVMQTTPVFVYLIPAVFFFGVGLTPGVVATTIFAIPPAVRLTDLGIRQVPADVVEAARAFGARP